MRQSPIKLRYLLLLLLFVCAVVGPGGLIVIGSILQFVVVLGVIFYVLPRVWRWLRANF